jgi:hypothetical protein
LGVYLTKNKRAKVRLLTFGFCSSKRFYHLFELVLGKVLSSGIKKFSLNAAAIDKLFQFFLHRHCFYELIFHRTQRQVGDQYMSFRIWQKEILSGLAGKQHSFSH